VWWALGFSALTTTCLAVLTAALVLMHGMGYVASAMLPGTEIKPPGEPRYGLALGLAVVINLAAAAALARLGARTPAGGWPPVVQGLTAAGLAATAAASALLLTVGISPLGFVASL
jgi:hypothetical protein